MELGRHEKGREEYRNESSRKVREVFRGIEGEKNDTREG
jgi:hypothetical protein